MFMYGVDVEFLSYVFGPGVRTIRRWYRLFELSGVVEEDARRRVSSRWPDEVVEALKTYVHGHPTFYLEELQDFLTNKFPTLKNISLPTICRALKFDMNLSRKALTKAAKEAGPAEVNVYMAKLKAVYSNPSQLVFVDETSKDGRHAYRRYAWSLKGTRAAVRLPFARGKRVSILAAVDVKGFMDWTTTSGTFTRKSFHDAFAKMVIPHLNPWPLPRSIVILDNAKIHMYKELVESIHQTGAMLLFLPPYCPQLNPIEICFSQLKRWIQRHANLAFPLYPEMVLDVAMKKCTEEQKGVLGLYAHCGYKIGGLKETIFQSLMD